MRVSFKSPKSWFPSRGFGYIGVCLAFAMHSFSVLADPTQMPLIRPVDLAYQGAFRVPQGTHGSSRFGYGGDAIAFRPVNGSLFISGFDLDDGPVAEISIPVPSIDAAVTDLPTASVLQPFHDITAGRIGGRDVDRLGGLLVNGNELIYTAYEFYDGDTSVTRSHGTSSLDLGLADAGEGLFQVGPFNAGNVGGYMAHVPQAWQPAIGAAHVTGQAAISIVGRTSDGPGLFGFNPDDFGEFPTPVETLVHYPYPNSLRPPEAGDEVFNRADTITGVAFPEGHRSVLFFGTHGLGEYCYGIGGAAGAGGACVDPARLDNGTHAYPYRHQVWAYDVLDMLKVKNGEVESWEIEPYQVWELELPFTTDDRETGGVAFDPATNRLFVAQQGVAAHTENFDLDVYPVIHVFELPTYRAGDFDQDNVLGCFDVDRLVSAIAEGEYQNEFDLNGDQRLDQNDLASWLDRAGAANQQSGVSYTVGDANLDGLVDGNDVDIWSTNRFATAGWCTGDFNADGFVDGSDFNLWNSNRTGVSDPAPVPEPNGTTLLVAVLMASAIVRRHYEPRS